MVASDAHEATWIAEHAWSLKLESVKPGSFPVLESLALARSMKLMDLRLIRKMQDELLGELRRARPRKSKLEALLKSAELIRRTERVLEKACGTHLKIAIETERRLQVTGRCPTCAGAVIGLPVSST